MRAPYSESNSFITFIAVQLRQNNAITLFRTQMSHLNGI